MISGTDVRIKVTRLAEETRADGKTILVCTFDKYTLRRGVTERLWVSDQPQPIHSISGLAREWSDLPVADVYEHLMRPWNSGYAIEIPIKGPLTSRFTLRPGNVIRLKRGDRVVFATYQLPPSCDPTDIAVQEFELSFEIE